MLSITLISLNTLYDYLIFQLVILITDIIMNLILSSTYLLILNNAFFLSLMHSMICDCEFNFMELFHGNYVKVGLKYSFCRECLVLLLSGI